MNIMQLRNSIANNLFKIAVIPKIKKRKRAYIDNAVQIQEKQLQYLLKKAEHTNIGKYYKFSDIRRYATYVKRVPLHSYDQLWNNWWKNSFPHIQNQTWSTPINFFAVSSGTSTGNTKYLPLSKEMMANNQQIALQTLGWCQQAGFDPLHGALLYLGGTTELQPLSKNTKSGDLSAIASHQRPWWIHPWFAPPSSISNIPNWNNRYQAILEYLATPRNITSISGVPIWITKLLQDVRTQKLPGLDKLQLIVHGGADIQPYLSELARLAPNIMRTEVYPASEGFIAIDTAPQNSWYQRRDLQLLIDNGIFFEFVPEEEIDTPNPTRIWLKNTEIGKNYALILTTNAGLWSYPIGDIVQITSKNPPRIMFAGRTAWYVAHFGAHITTANIRFALDKSNLGQRTFCFGAIEPRNNTQGRHRLIIELDKNECHKDEVYLRNNDINLPPINLHDKSDQQRLIDTFDACLRKSNIDFDSMRKTPFVPLPPQIWCIPPHGFSAMLESIGKGGGQNKVPNMVHNYQRFATICNQLREHVSVIQTI